MGASVVNKYAFKPQYVNLERKKEQEWTENLWHDLTIEHKYYMFVRHMSTPPKDGGNESIFREII